MGLIDQPMQLCKKSCQKLIFGHGSNQHQKLGSMLVRFPLPASLAFSNFGMPVKRVTRLVLASQRQRQRQRWGEPTTFRRRLELLSQVNFGLGHGGHQNEIHHPTSGNLEIKMLQPQMLDKNFKTPTFSKVWLSKINVKISMWRHQVFEDFSMMSHVPFPHP